MNTLEKKDKLLQQVGLELMFSNSQNRTYSEGLTAIELSRKLKIKMDLVKKKLKLLQGKGIVRSNGVSPKFWTFDDYTFQRMNEEDPVYSLLCDFADVDFDQFFKY